MGKLSRYDLSGEIYERMSRLRRKAAVERKDLVDHLADAWCLRETSASSYVNTIERGSILCWAQFQQWRVEIFEQRLADYFCALGTTKQQSAPIYATFRRYVWIERMPSEVEPMVASVDYDRIVYGIKQVKNPLVLAKIEKLVDENLPQNVREEKRANHRWYSA